MIFQSVVQTTQLGIIINLLKPGEDLEERLHSINRMFPQLQG